MKKFRFTLAIFAAALFLASCSNKADFDYYYYTPEEKAILEQTLNLPEFPDDYTIEFPAHLRNSGLFVRPVERDKAVLGRVLFYDKKLSKDGTVSCANCHRQELGFSDDKKVSLGVQGRAGERNSIALSSVANFSAYYGTDINGSGAIRFFWDNRAETAKEQSTGSMTNPLEMDMKMEEIAEVVRQQPYYAPLFKKAFGDTYVSKELVLEAVANFINAMGSYQSKFDQEASSVALYNTNYSAPFSGFTDAENRGKLLFMQNCASCHSQNQGRPVLFNASNGLDAVTVDEGVGGQSNQASEMGTFKVPTLRNITITAPYMHDGRFQTLEEVVEHYSSGVKAHPNLHSALRNTDGSPKHMGFDAGQKSDLVAFLATLKDEKIIVEERFSNPFK